MCLKMCRKYHEYLYVGPTVEIERASATSEDARLGSASRPWDASSLPFAPRSRAPRLLASRPSPRTWRGALCSALGLLSQLLPPLRAAAHTGGGTWGLTATPRPHPRVCFLVAHLSLKDAPPFPHGIPGNTSPEDLARAFGPRVPGASLASGPCHSALGTPHAVVESAHSSEPLSSPGTP